MKKTTLLIALMATTSFGMLSAQVTDPAPYCVATFDDDPFNIPNAIKGVTFGTLANASLTQYAFPHYVFYNNLAVPDFVRGSTHTLAVVFEVNGGCGYGVWIDYNQDNVFDASEKVSGTPIGSSMDINDNTIITESITIPANAMFGQTRMRVRIVEDDNYTFGANGYSIQPCNASTSVTDIMDWGETEDYTINIIGTSSVKELENNVNFAIYPNPVKNFLSINQMVSGTATYKIVNIAGQEVRAGSFNSNQSQVDVSNLAEGIYIIELFGKQSLGQQKFVKVSK